MDFSFNVKSLICVKKINEILAAVHLLLDKGSDINAQIETNRNTALTLACFQGRHEVVSLLLERRANIEHRAKVNNYKCHSRVFFSQKFTVSFFI